MRKIISGICLFGLFAAACMSDADKLTVTQLMLLIPVFTAGKQDGKKEKKALTVQQHHKGKGERYPTIFSPSL